MSSEHLDQDYRYAFPELQIAWKKEREAVKAVLKKHKVQVFRPRLLTDGEKQAGGDNGYYFHCFIY
ncbi:hypothetical protein [Pedobacter gandavensis]|uniref:hypothetical protein n=1 Tax=Pedobacter gandavensis TaxID=2679963 RepID=UPI00292E297D|nr:hypothetical protein [Pedobacter gandavensis]